MISIGFKDKNEIDIKVGHHAITTDKTGKILYGEIVKVDPRKIVSSRIVRSGGIQYAFKSNYETWINDQEFASTLEITYKPYNFEICQTNGLVYIFDRDTKQYLFTNGAIRGYTPSQKYNLYYDSIEQAKYQINKYYRPDHFFTIEEFTI